MPLIVSLYAWFIYGQSEERWLFVGVVKFRDIVEIAEEGILIGCPRMVGNLEFGAILGGVVEEVQI